MLFSFLREMFHFHKNFFIYEINFLFMNKNCISGSLCLSHSVDVICIGIGILHVSQHSLNTELHYSPFQLNMAFVHLIVIIQSCNWYLEKIIIFTYSKFWFSSFSVQVNPFHGITMNNLLSYCGLIDAKIRAFDKDLPVIYNLGKEKYTWWLFF